MLVQKEKQLSFIPQQTLTAITSIWQKAIPIKLLDQLSLKSSNH